MKDSPLLYTVERAAERLEISRTTVYELIRAGALESIKIGGARRIPAAALHDYVERLRAEQSGSDALPIPAA
jgi:excisionase family DNA binding protein